MKKFFAIMVLIGFVGTVSFSSCVRASKSCKSNQKKISKMRKSGQIKM